MAKNEWRQFEIPASDMYEHEMFSLETKGVRAFWDGLLAIVLTCLIVSIAIFAMPNSLASFTDFVFFLSCFTLFSYMVYVLVHRIIVDSFTIKLTITEKELLIRFPRDTSVHYPSWTTTVLKFQFHEIVDVSIRNPRSSELECIMEEGGVRKEFKLASNRDISFNLRNRSRYKYLIRSRAIYSNQPFSDDTQFVDIEFQGGWRMLIEFDDAENFVSVLKQRIPQRVYSPGRAVF